VDNKFEDFTAVVWACEMNSIEAIHRLKYHGANITNQQRNHTPLYWAAYCGSHGATCALINLGADVHETNTDITPLVVAVFWHQWHIVELLMGKYGAKVDPNSSVIRYALRTTFQPNLAKRLKVIRFFLDVGVNVNAGTVTHATPLFHATTREEVLELVKAGAVVEVVDSQMHSPLFSAVIEDRIEAVKALIEVGANVHRRDKNGNTALFHAEHAHNEEMVKILLFHRLANGK
jgi:serine/threonine-protein phosphatase 6 regulatory ankyrin repeat subunit B